MLDKLQIWICRTVGPSLAVSLEPLAHCRNVTSLSLLYRHYFGRCLSELAPLPYSRGNFTRSVTYPEIFFGIPLVSKITCFSVKRSPLGAEGQKILCLILVHCWKRHLRHFPVILSWSRFLLFCFFFWCQSLGADTASVVSKS